MSRGPEAPCNGPETQAQWKSDSVTDGRTLHGGWIQPTHLEILTHLKIPSNSIKIFKSKFGKIKNFNDSTDKKCLKQL